MKKVYLMKGMAVMAMGLVIASCSKDVFDPNALQAENEEAFNNNFQTNVLNGQEIDENQTWSTAVATKVTVSAQSTEGTLKVYAADPIGNTVAPLYTAAIAKGEKTTFTVARPSDVTTLYVAIYDSEGYIVSLPAVVSNNNVSVVFENISMDSSVSQSSVARRAIASNWNGWLSAPSDRDFPTAADPNADDGFDAYPSYHTWPNDREHHAFKAPTGYNAKINLWEGEADIYFMPGTTTVDELYINTKTNIYFLPGANVTFLRELNYNYSNVNIYICSSANVTCNEGLNINANLYNRGTVTIKGGKASGVYANGAIYNEGTMKFQGTATTYYDSSIIRPYGQQNVPVAFQLNNSDSQFINAGTLEANGMLVAGSAHFRSLENAIVTVKGYSVVNSNNCSWVNNGTYTTDYFSYAAGSNDVINNCKLICKETFSIALGDGSYETKNFKLDGSIECKNFYHGNGHTIMASNSIIKVSQTITCNGTTAGGLYGFYGPTAANTFAVVQAAKITAVSLTQKKSIVYKNNVIIATDDHWTQCDPNDGNYPYYILDTESGAKMAKNKNSIGKNIPASKCNVGLNGGTSSTSDPIMYYYYAFEDLGTTDDFDFNDVVLRVSARNAQGKCTVDLMAAGGTMSTVVKYNGTQIGSEVHNAFSTESVKTMVNTNATNGLDNQGPANLSTIDVAADADLTNLPLSITCQSGSSVFNISREGSAQNKGQAPLVIVVSGDSSGKWYWPKERVNISTAYSKFGAWGANATSNASWYLNYANGQVYSW